MMQDTPDDLLISLADGELDRADAARLRLRMRSDPALAARYAAFVESRALIEGTLADEAVPPALRASVEGLVHGNTADPNLQMAKAHTVPIRRTSGRWLPMGMAASAALALGGVLGWSLASRDAVAPSAFVTDRPVVWRAVQGALAGLPAGELTNIRDPISGQSVRLAVVATHRLADGQVCRRFEVALDGPEKTREIGLACREGGAWRGHIFARAPSGQAYSPASGDLDPVDRYLEGMGGAGPLPPEQERALLHVPGRE